MNLMFFDCWNNDTYCMVYLVQHLIHNSHLVALSSDPFFPLFDLMHSVVLVGQIEFESSLVIFE